MTAFSYTATGRTYDPHLAYLKKWLPKAVALVKRAPAEISIVLVGNAKMAALHQLYLSLPGPTDVLTFELDHDARNRCTAGEIVVCVPYALREAAKQKVAAKNELLLYALHGVLHLSGYDDLTPNEHARMHREEDRILDRIGIGRVFAR